MQICADIENHSTYRQQIEIFPKFFEAQWHSLQVPYEAHRK